ncbi:MAG: UDP-2,3-diacylglucosamine diphosphatase [Panacagrimonas sp.]
MKEPRPTLFLSDLHLPVEPSPLRDRFLLFLQGPAREAAAVFILGDLFETWIGDDVGMPFYEAEVAGLAALTATGVPVYFQHGNRDFMVGAAFFRRTGVRLLPDPHRIELNGRASLISHGDVLCTDDRDYQRWRRFSRLRPVQWIFLRLPRARREKISGGLRSGSDQAKRNKAENIMDVNAAAVRATMTRFDVTQLIHGHTHRPGTYTVELPTGSAQRIVLPDWRDEVCDFLRADGSRIARVAADEASSVSSCAAGDYSGST